REHAGKVEAGDPFPRILMLSRSVPSRCSKRKDPAAVLRQSRRADHDLTHALAVVKSTSTRRPAATSPSNPRNIPLHGTARRRIIPIFADLVTDSAARFIADERQGRRPPRRPYKAPPPRGGRWPAWQRLRPRADRRSAGRQSR